MSNTKTKRKVITIFPENELFSKKKKIKYKVFYLFIKNNILWLF